MARRPRRPATDGVGIGHQSTNSKLPEIEVSPSPRPISTFGRNDSRSMIGPGIEVRPEIELIGIAADAGADAGARLLSVGDADGDEEGKDGRDDDV